jgi:hypothetical protein
MMPNPVRPLNPIFIGGDLPGMFDYFRIAVIQEESVVGVVMALNRIL